MHPNRDSASGHGEGGVLFEFSLCKFGDKNNQRTHAAASKHPWADHLGLGCTNDVIDIMQALKMAL